MTTLMLRDVKLAQRVLDFFSEATRCYRDRAIQWRYNDDGDAFAMTRAITLNLLFSFESYTQ